MTLEEAVREKKNVENEITEFIVSKIAHLEDIGFKVQDVSFKAWHLRTMGKELIDSSTLRVQIEVAL